MYSSSRDPGGMVRTSKAAAMPLVFVPTPLGNLRDVTLRALDALRECRLLVAEDARVARKLLAALALPGKEIWTYHEHNAAAATEGILDRARTELVAVVTDAGTPGISDPGGELIAAARGEGVPVEVLPGPSALVGAAVLSGFPLRRFVFEGFAPRTSGARRTAFARTLSLGIPSVWYESPQRVRRSLSDLDAVDPHARVFLLREYTKRFEQQVSGTPREVSDALGDPVRGEIAFVVMPSAREATASNGTDLERAIDELLNERHTVSDIAKALSERGYGQRRALYARASARKRIRAQNGETKNAQA